MRSWVFVPSQVAAYISGPFAQATADLDTASANELVQVVEEQFKDTTVLSIAHRLNFIR